MADVDNVADAPLRVLVIDKIAVLSSIRERYERLARRASIELTVLLPAKWMENYRDEYYQTIPDASYTTVVGRVVWPGREQRSFYHRGMIRAFLRSQPEVILMMEESFSLFGLQTLLLKTLLAPGAKVIFYSNNITSYHRSLYRPSLFFRLLGKVVGGMSDYGLCVNEKAEQVLKDARLPIKTRHLFYGINERLFSGSDRAEARRVINIPDNTTLFLYAGRLLELKGIQDLILAFSQLYALRPDASFKLLIVGSGSYQKELRELARNQECYTSIEFREMVPIDKMPLYMKAADAFILPSRDEIQEQFGRVNAEAMLTGTTIIGSTSGEIPTVIGKGGFIYQAGNVEALVKTLQRFLDDPAEVERRRALGKEIALQNYSMDAFVEGLIDVFEEIAERPLRRKTVSTVAATTVETDTEAHTK